MGNTTPAQEHTAECRGAVARLKERLKQAGDRLAKSGLVMWLRGVLGPVCGHASKNRRALGLCVAAWVLAGLAIAVGGALGWPTDRTAIGAGVLAALGLLFLGKFLPADWFLAFLLCLTAAFYVGAVAYQADVRDDAGREQVSIEFNGGAQRNIALRISHPKMIPLEPADKPGWPLSVYFQPPVSEPIQSLTQPLTCVVSLTPDRPNVVEFTDKDGVPLPPRLTVSPHGKSEPPALYLRQNTTFTRATPVTVTVAITVHHACGQPAALSGSPTLVFALEDARTAWWRHFRALLLGPTTPFIAVAGSVVALAVWWWQEEQKGRREAERNRRKVRNVRELAERSATATDPTERASCLEQAERELDAVRQKYVADPDLRDELRLATEAVRRAQLNQIRSIATEDLGKADKQYRELQAKKDQEGWQDERLMKLHWEVGAMIKRLAPRPGPPEIPAVATWVKVRGLNFNPFGPEKAEDDPYFLQRCIEPPAWDEITRCAPTIIEGAPGSGRTAARLYLAHYCEEHGLVSPAGEPDALVVPMEWPPEGPISQADIACPKALAAAIAEANLRQLAQQPDLFDRTPFRQQQALALLFRLARNVIGDPEVYLERHGLERARAEQIASLVDKMAQHLTMPQYEAEPDLVRLLARARLAGCSQYFVCVEIPDEPSDSEPTAEIKVHAQALGSMMTPLAKAAVSLKVFVRADRAHLLQAPDTIRHATLIWKEDKLAALLRERLKATGAADDIRSLFPSIKGDLEGQLLDAALKSPGAPRELIRLGNALILEDAMKGPLTWKKARGVLGVAQEGSHG